MKVRKLFFFGSVVVLLCAVGCTEKATTSESTGPMKQPLTAAPIGGAKAAPPPPQLPPKGDSTGPQAQAPKTVD